MRRRIIIALPISARAAVVFRSTEVPCAACGIACWLAPSSCASLHDGAEVRCVACALAQVEHDGGGTVLPPTRAQRAEIAANRREGRN